MEKAIKLKLSVDTKSGEVAVKKLTNSLKGMSASMATTGGASMGTVMAAGMLVMGTSTVKAATKMAKLKETTTKMTKTLSEFKKYQTEAVGWVDKMVKAEEANIKTQKKAINVLDKHTRAVNKHKKAYKGFWGTLAKVRHHYLALITTAAIAAVTVGKFFQVGFGAVEKFNVSVATLAATITSFSKTDNRNIEDVYKNAYNYSVALVEQMEIWNALTLATGANLNAMVAVMAQSGVLIDINNAKQVQGVITLSNAIAVMTQGQDQEKQFRQEIRALMAGEARAGSLLAQYMKAKVGDLKATVKLWKEEDVIVEKMAYHLRGFAIASADIAKTWTAVKTTLQTVGIKVLRGMFKPIYRDIIRITHSINDSLIEQDENTKRIVGSLETGVYKSWVAIKSTIKSVGLLIETFKTPLVHMVSLVGMMANGWGFIIAILPAFVTTLKRMAEFVHSITDYVWNLGAGLAGIITLDFKFAKKSFEKASKNISEGFEALGKLSSDEFAVGFWKGFDEYTARLEDIKKKWNLPEIEGAGDTDDKATATAKKLQTEIRKAEIELEKQGYKKRKALLNLERDLRIANAKETGENVLRIYDLYLLKQSALSLEQSKKERERYKEDRKQRQEADNEALEAKKKIADFTFKGTDLELDIRDVKDQVEDLKKLAVTEQEVIDLKAAGIRLISGLRKEQNDKDKKAADEKLQKEQDIHEKMLSYISTESENKLRAMQQERDARMEDATNLEDKIKIFQAYVRKEKELYAEMKQNREDDYENQKSVYTKWVEDITSMPKLLDDFAIQASESFTSGTVDSLWDFVEGTKTAKEAWESFAASFAKEMISMVVKTIMLNTIKTLMGKTSETSSEKAVTGLVAESTAAVTTAAAYTAVTTAKVAMASVPTEENTMKAAVGLTAEATAATTTTVAYTALLAVVTMISTINESLAESSIKTATALASESAAAITATAAYTALAIAKAAAGASSGGGASEGAVVAPNALGNVYKNGQKMMAYAKGGIIDRPTTFPIKNGIGIMAEAGEAEAIMPLKRGRDGRLGVGASDTTKQAPQPAPIYLQMTTITDPRQIQKFMGTREFKDGIVNIIGAERSRNNRRLM